MRRYLTAFQTQLRGPLLILLGQASQSFSTFITTLIIARWAGASELGYYALAYSFCFLAVCLCDALLTTPYTYFYASFPARRQSMLRAAIIGSLGLALILGLGVYAASMAGMESLSKTAILLPFVLLALVLRDVFKRHLYVAEKLAIAFFSDALSSSLQIALVLLLALLDRLSAATALAAIVVTTSMPIVIFFKHMDIGSKPRWNTELGEWLGQYFTYGRWLMLGTACHVAGTQLYPWLAMSSGGATSAGSFAACMALANLLNPLLIGLTNYFRPRLMEHHLDMPPDEFIRYVGRVTVCFIAPAAAFVLLAFLQSEELLMLAYGDEFRAATETLLYLALGGLFIALAAPLQLALLATRAPITNLLYHASILLLLIFASFLTWDFLTPTELSRIYFGVNFAGTLILSFFFWIRLARK